MPGCGRGHEAALLAQLGFQAIGLDVSGKALAELWQPASDSAASRDNEWLGLWR